MAIELISAVKIPGSHLFCICPADSTPNSNNPAAAGEYRLFSVLFCGRFANTARKRLELWGARPGEMSRRDEMLFSQLSEPHHKEPNKNTTTAVLHYDLMTTINRQGTMNEIEMK